MSEQTLQANTALTTSNNTTTSLIVAEKFGKRHDDVLKRINLLEIPDEYRLRNFAERVREVSHGAGQCREYKYYELTRDGFALLAMGFTGKKAMAWKIKFLEAFNAMEAQLTQPTLSPAQCRSIQEAVNERAFRTGETHQFIYSGLKTAFRVAKYDQIKATDFDAAMQHIGYASRETVTLGVGYGNEQLCNDIIEHGESLRLAQENFSLAQLYMLEAEKHLTPARKKFIAVKTNAVHGRVMARKALQCQ